MARARNQGRPALAWSLCVLLVFAVTFLLALRIAGATPPDPVAEDAVVDDALVEDALVDDALVDDALVDDALIDELVDDTLVEGGVVDDAILDDAILDDAIDDDAVLDDAVLDDAILDDAVLDDAREAIARARRPPRGGEVLVSLGYRRADHRVDAAREVDVLAAGVPGDARHELWLTLTWRR